MKTIILVIFSLSLCNYTFCNERAANKLIDKIFSADEVEDIHHFVSAIDSLVMTQAPSGSLTESYKIILLDFFTGNTEGIIDNQQKFTELIRNYMQASFFDGIWETEIGFNNTNQAKYELLIFNIEGQYLDFLKNMKNENNLYSGYYESIKEYADIIPTNNGWLFDNFSNIDFSNYDEHFLIAVHLSEILYEKEICR